MYTPSRISPLLKCPAISINKYYKTQRYNLLQRFTSTRVPTSDDCLPENDIFLMATTSPSLFRACHGELYNLLHYKHALHVTYIIYCSKAAMSNFSLVSKYRIRVVLREDISPFGVFGHILWRRFCRHSLGRTTNYSITKLPRPSTDNKYSTNIITLVS